MPLGRVDLTRTSADGTVHDYIGIVQVGNVIVRLTYSSPDGKAANEKGSTALARLARGRPGALMVTLDDAALESPGPLGLTLDALGDALGAAADGAARQRHGRRPRRTCADVPGLDGARPRRPPGHGAPLGASHLRGAPVDPPEPLSGRGPRVARRAGLVRRGRDGPAAGGRRRARRPRRVRLPQGGAGAAALLDPPPVPRDDDPRGRRARGPAAAGRPAPTRRGSRPASRSTASTSCSSGSSPAAARAPPPAATSAARAPRRLRRRVARRARDRPTVS